MQVWSIGHSTHSLAEFAALLESAGIGAIADIRTVPKSRRHPHFAKESLARELPARGVAYRHLDRLGGWRRPRADSPNAGWRIEAFRGYADYTATPEFQAGLAELLELARGDRTAMMCAEGLWWRCHRRLVADQLLIRGIRVLHIGPAGRVAAHERPPFAVATDGALTYPPPPPG